MSDVKRKNGIGIAGLVLSIIGFVFCWLPIFNFVLWVLGFVFSLIGVFKKPKGTAIAGLIISGIWWIVLLTFFGAFLSFLF